MEDKEFNELLIELSREGEDVTAERKTEIITSLQNERKSQIEKYNELSNNTAKLQSDYQQLKNKRVEEFFNYGSDVNNPSPTNNSNIDNKVDDETISPEEIVDYMLGE